MKSCLFLGSIQLTKSEKLRAIITKKSPGVFQIRTKKYQTKATKKKKFKLSQENVEVIIHIHATFNNTIITITDLEGRTKLWSSCGSVNFKGSRRSTGYAAQTAGEKVSREARNLGISSAQVQLKGLGVGRHSAVKGLQLGGLRLTKLIDCTPIAHNGCRPRKKRRV